MNKLTIALAAMLGMMVANAATINWGSGAIQTPNPDTGALSGTKLTTASGYNVKMYVWEALTEASVSYAAGDLFNWYKDGASSTKDPFGTETPITAISVAPTTGTSATTANAVGKLAPATVGDSVYAAVLFVLEDATSGDAKWYIENSANKASGKAVQAMQNLALKVGGGTSTIATVWVAVPADIPEPTSGVLMLLGMAGLALRRRRA